MFCAKCKDVVTDFVTCQGSQCNGRFHYGCAGIAETTYRKMGPEKKAAWRCPTCRVDSEKSASPSLSELMNELKEFRSEFHSMKSDISSIKSEFQSTSQYMQDLSSKLCNLDSRFTKMEERLALVEAKTATLATLQQSLTTAEHTIAQLQKESNQQNQFSRLNNLEIVGVPERNGENITSILRDICNKVGFSLAETDVDTIHRVRPFNDINNKSIIPTRHPSIIVRFTQRHRRNQLLAAVRARRGLTSADIGLPGAAYPLYVNEHLTPTNKLLLKKSRERKVELNYSYLWIRDCKILLRKNDKSKVLRVSDESDLLKLQ